MSKPLFQWLNFRAAGVLLHPTSLPSNVGIGNFGHSAYQFVDWLKDSGVRYWQMCPIGPTGYGDSPYQSFSAFAGNPYLINLEGLFEFGLLEDKDLHPLKALAHHRADYGALYQRLWPVLRLAFRRFQQKQLNYLANYGIYEEFKEKEAAWLDPYAYFMALKTAHNGQSWDNWKPEYRDYSTFSQNTPGSEIEEQAEMHRFLQYLFFGQWSLLRNYSRNKGIEIIGDIPIFVSYDSADVWANPELFQLTKKGKPKAVAGVPPDYFSPDGQLWGNPLFDWKKLKKQGYGWWIKRLEKSFELYDVVRLDHFRGFEAYWSVPAGAETARKGTWEPGPGLDFFKTVAKALPDAHLIAEDLGLITPEVVQLIQDTGMPNMAILHFSFDGNATNGYLPHNLDRNTTVYTGSHDNDTTRSWYAKEPQAVQDQFRRYFRVSGQDAAWDLIRAAMASVANLAIIPMQDILDLDGDARMNTPGKPSGNWQWRMTHEQLEKVQGGTASYLRELGELYGRIKIPKESSEKQ